MARPHPRLTRAGWLATAGDRSRRGASREPTRRGPWFLDPFVPTEITVRSSHSTRWPAPDQDVRSPRRRVRLAPHPPRTTNPLDLVLPPRSRSLRRANLRRLNDFRTCVPSRAWRSIPPVVLVLERAPCELRILEDGLQKTMSLGCGLRPRRVDARERRDRCRSLDLSSRSAGPSLSGRGRVGESRSGTAGILSAPAAASHPATPVRVESTSVRFPAAAAGAGSGCNLLENMGFRRHGRGAACFRKSRFYS